MANPYNQPSASGFNSSPPPDDGSTGADNIITWAGVLAKLAQPLYNWSDAINSAVESAFDEIFLNAASAVSSPYTVQASDRGALLYVTGTTTITLLAAATATSGFPLVIVNGGTATVTIDADTSELINGSTTLTLEKGGWAVLICTGTLWYAHQGVSGVTATNDEINVLDGIPATLTATELGYVDGVTSAIQTQLNNLSTGPNFSQHDHSGRADTAATWASTTAYALGDLIVGTATDANIYFECTTAGNSGSTEPTWDQDPGDTTADGTVVWTAHNSAGDPVVLHNGLKVQYGSATLASTANATLSAATAVALDDITTVFGILVISTLEPNVATFAQDSGSYAFIGGGFEHSWGATPSTPSAGNINISFYNNTGGTTTCPVRYIIWGT